MQDFDIHDYIDRNIDNTYIPGVQIDDCDTGDNADNINNDDNHCH